MQNSVFTNAKKKNMLKMEQKHERMSSFVSLSSMNTFSKNFSKNFENEADLRDSGSFNTNQIEGNGQYLPRASINQIRVSSVGMNIDDSQTDAGGFKVEVSEDTE